MISDVPDEVRTLLLVGHNPGLADLAVSLAREATDAAEAAAMDRLSEKFPTSAIAGEGAAGYGPNGSCPQRLGEVHVNGVR
ncbi:hypothetical protein ACWGDE_02815 [Streptomyces sp. NPDC054956]